ncbi:MAG TPA: ABC transporter ATP-binding protein [Anaerolineae bacterium]|nr:ABC transporter ATP-binding protein [Anaerolineae bacterium]
MTRVDLDGLTKIYPGGDQAAVDELSLTIPGGCITALLGPSGCGKTTALKIIAGLIEPTRGDVLFDGESVLVLPPERREAVMAFQNHLLFPHMSVGENVGFGLKMRGVAKSLVQKRVAEMLALVQLPGLENRRPTQLSGGQQQRVALARALIIEPRVLLLDEPLSNLDAHLRAEMRELILDIQGQLSLTTIFVTHDQEEAVVLADQIALLFEGRLQQFGPPRSFYERPKSERVARFFGGVNFVPGLKRDQQIETSLGRFECRSQLLADGPVLLTIRPENIQLSRNGVRPNTTSGRISEGVYLGTHARFIVEAAPEAGGPPISLEVIAEAGAINQFPSGQVVNLHFPPDKIWLVPTS